MTFFSCSVIMRDLRSGPAMTRAIASSSSSWPIAFLLLRAARIAASLIRLLKSRSEEHTSELQSPCNLVCRLLLEKKNALVARRDSLLKILDKNATVGVVRLKHDIGKENHIGFLATTYNFVDKYNDIAGFDTRYRFNKTTVFTAQVLGSVSHRPFFFADEAATADRKERGLAYAYNLDVSGRNWGYNYAAVGRSRFFRADVGFNQRFNTNNQDLFVRYKSNDHPKAKIINWRVFNNATVNFDW